MKGCDFETFSDVNIKVHGAARYFQSPRFEVLIAGIADDLTAPVGIDFVFNRDEAMDQLNDIFRHGDLISAHNASFERMCFKKLGFNLPPEQFVDSAVTARAMGAGSKLEAAAPQLLDIDKMELGAGLIQIFSVPTKENGGQPYTWQQIMADVTLRQQWEDFHRYCQLDAKLSFDINDSWNNYPVKEWDFEVLTQEMNDRGWFVDLALVHEMQRRYHENLRVLQEEFRSRLDPNGTLNFNSHPQLVRWCEARGVRAKSFDQQALPKLQRQLLRKIDALLPNGLQSQDKIDEYREVLSLIQLKQEMGGSSLSKLQTIIDQTSEDGRLRGQYLHVGAGQTYRTSGRGVQLQNLARLGVVIGDVQALVNEPTEEWDNSMLSENIRQVFEAEHPDGELIVGDFKSVESRGLAYMAGETWKLDAYRNGLDVYVMLAATYSSNAGTPYEEITKPQRQGGKVGELSCGYGAGPSAVQGFAEKMGIDMDTREAALIVNDWRGANPETVNFWRRLDAGLRLALGGKAWSMMLPSGGKILMHQSETPLSLTKQHPGAQSITLEVYDAAGNRWMSRVFHGCYLRGGDVHYYKPSELKGGELWRARSAQPPHFHHKLYGGKVAGILTQSFCRELFFQSMQRLEGLLANVTNAQLIGQFHDELVVEWWPSNKVGAHPLDAVKHLMQDAMTFTGRWKDFPLDADIKHAHRYIK